MDLLVVGGGERGKAKHKTKDPPFLPVIDFAEKKKEEEKARWCIDASIQ